MSTLKKMEKKELILNQILQDLTLFEKEISYLKYDFQVLTSKINRLEERIEKESSFNFKEKIIFLEEQIETIKNEFSTKKSVFEIKEERDKTQKEIIKPLKDKIWGISIGNEGVKTDRQTDRQTDKTNKNEFEMALETMGSLNYLKEEIKLKFQKLTPQENLIFAMIYQLEEGKNKCTYSLLSSKLNLSQSVIRDHVRRIIGKGIPLEKEKINNKEINLKVNSSLKKMLSLNSFLDLSKK